MFVRDVREIAIVSGVKNAIASITKGTSSVLGASRKKDLVNDGNRPNRESDCRASLPFLV
jgi:hypothetical protein